MHAFFVTRGDPALLLVSRTHSSELICRATGSTAGNVWIAGNETVMQSQALQQQLHFGLIAAIGKYAG